jgi:hypothetical protein
MARSACLNRSAGARRWILLLGASAVIGGCGSGTVADGSSAQGGNGDAGCATGSEGCACYANDTCNAVLTCASHLCVNLGTGGRAQGGTSAGGTSSGGAAMAGTPSGGSAQGGTSSGGTRTGGTGTGGTYSCLLGNPCSTPSSFCVNGNVVCECMNGLWGSCSVTNSGGAPATGGSPSGGRAVGGYPSGGRAVGGDPSGGMMAVGGYNNPPGCPGTQPANRTNCTQGTGPCTYGNQQCQCGQFYSTTYQWSCGNAPPAAGGTGTGGRATGGRPTGGAPPTGGRASGGGGTGGMSGGTGGTGGSPSGGVPSTGGAGTAGAPPCVSGAACSTGYVCSPTGGGACICVAATLTCFNVQGGAGGSAGSPPASGGAPGTAGNAGAGGAGADCAVGLPCGADASTCTRDPGDGGSVVTCFCVGGIYVVCA